MGKATKASEKKYKMITMRDAMVPMRDGVHLAVDIFRPDSGERFPALLALSPYGKGIQSMTIPRQPEPSPIHHTPIEAGNPEYPTVPERSTFLGAARRSCRHSVPFSSCR